MHDDRLRRGQLWLRPGLGLSGWGWGSRVENEGSS